MATERFGPETRPNYLCDVGRFATWLQHSPHTPTAEDIRQFQTEHQEAGVLNRWGGCRPIICILPNGQTNTSICRWSDGFQTAHCIALSPGEHRIVQNVQSRTVRFGVEFAKGAAQRSDGRPQAGINGWIATGLIAE